MKYISASLALFSVAMCLVISYFLVFTDLLSERLSGTNRQILIAVLIAYALYRSYRIIKLLKTQR